MPLNAYKILIFNPHFGKSHVQFLGAIADLLVGAGHDVTQLAQLMSPVVDTNGSQLAKTITIPPDPKLMKIFDFESFIEDGWKQRQQSVLAVMNLFAKLSNLYSMSCELQIRNTRLMDQMKAEKFDLAISETFDPCSLGMIELFQIPAHISVSATGIIEHTAAVVGMPNFPSYVPSMFMPFTDQMTYSERAVNLLFIILSKMWTEQIMAREQAIYRKLYGEQFIDLHEKAAQATYLLTNVDPFFDIPKPMIHKVMEISGIGVQKANPLSEEWTAVMNQRKKVVLVSFGTAALSHLMPNDTKKAFLEAFDSFPDVTFVWKYEKEEHHITEGHPNVVTAKWLPQTDLLAHPNLVAFLTHGGMNSLTETVNCGKPIIVIPIFGDQMRNAVLAKRSGFGIMLSISEISVKGKLRDALDRIINDKSYSRKAERLSRMIAKRPNPSKEQLIRHVEFAAEFGRIPNFDPYGRKMPFISYFMLDIIIPFVLLVLFVLAAFCYAFFRFFSLFVLKSGGSNGQKEAEKKIQ